MSDTASARRYRLLGAGGVPYASDHPGTLGGNRALKIYGRLDCRSAVAALPKGYARHRVFFADRDAAIAAGYRPCHTCLRDEYRKWRAGPRPGVEYPWKTAPDGGRARGG